MTERDIKYNSKINVRQLCMRDKEFSNLSMHNLGNVGY